MRILRAIFCLAMVILAFAGATAREPERRLLVKVNGKYGFITEAGEIAIPPVYDGARPFAEGRAAVQLGENWGYVDPDGHLAIPARFDAAHDFSEGLAEVRVGKNYGFIDPSGKIAIPAKLDHAGNFLEGMAIVQMGEKSGVIGKTGDLLIPAEFDVVNRECSGVFSVARGAKKGFIDRMGNPVTAEAVRNMVGCAGELRVEVTDGPIVQHYGLPVLSYTWYDFVDRLGRRVFEKRFQRASRFSEDLAAVSETRDQFGYIDKTGQWVIRPRFAEAQPFSEGLAAVRVEYLWSYIDKTGREIVPAAFSKALDFHEGRAGVQMGSEWGYVDSTGKIVAEPRFDEAGSFQEGLARVSIGNAYSYIDKTGTLIWDPDLYAPKQTTRTTSAQRFWLSLESVTTASCWPFTALAVLVLVAGFVLKVVFSRPLIAGVAGGLMAVAGVPICYWVALPRLEAGAWESARSADTTSSYRAYLASWPKGSHAGQAERRLRAQVKLPYVFVIQRSKRRWSELNSVAVGGKAIPLASMTFEGQRIRTRDHGVLHCRSDIEHQANKDAWICNGSRTQVDSVETYLRQNQP